MLRKPRPLPLSLTQAKIEKEKLEVLKRTERRISVIAWIAEAEANLPQSSRLLTLAFLILILLLYTAFTFFTKCQCTCACAI
jgi:hypothetical protein